MFEYRHQPLKTLYSIYATFTIVLRLPVWTIMALLPQTKPRKSWPVSRTLRVWLIDAVFTVWFKIGLPQETIMQDNPDDGLVWMKPIADELVMGEIKLMADTNDVKPERVPAYWHGSKGVDGNYGQRANPGEKVLYYFHGGGYAMGTAGSKENSISSPYTICIPSRSPDIFQRSFGIEYRLSSAPPLERKNPFPAALLDAVAGYRYLVEDLEFKPKDIILCGDSAGGHLAIALTRYLILANLHGLSVPGAVIVISPTGDWGHTHDTGSATSSNVANRNSDFVSEIMSNGYTGRCLAGLLPIEEIQTNPWFSPASLRVKKLEGLFKGFPPTIIICGEAEQARDDKRTLKDRMIADCGEANVVYREYEDAAHDFPMMRWHEPERTQALDDIHEWLTKVTSE